MQENKTQQTLNAEGAGFTGDRCTVTLRAHYQEYAPNNVTSVSLGYDFTNPSAAIPWQTSQMIHPTKPVALNLGHLVGESCMLVLSHDKARISANAAVDLRKVMDSNIITLTNAEGVVVGLIRARRAFLGEFPFPIFAQSSHATAILSITAIPVYNEEISA